MSDTITATLVENTETITATLYDGGDEIIAHINELARGPAGADGSGGGGGGGSGTVTSVSVTTTNGISGTVANPTTTPAITLTLGAITPTSVAASGNVTGSNLSGTNTGDQTNITGNAGTVTSIGDLTGVVTSTNRATAIANGALSIAKTSGLQDALDGKAASSHTHTSSAITDSTSNGITNPEKVLKTTEDGTLDLRELTVGNPGNLGNVIFWDGVGANVAVYLASGFLRTAGAVFVQDTTTQTLTNKTLTNPTVNNYVEGVVAIGNSGTSQTLSLTNGTVQTCTLTGNCTFTMPTATAGKSFVLYLKTGTGSFTSAFTGVKWSGGVAPTITTTASRMDILTFVADGTNWYGSSLQNFTP